MTISLSETSTHKTIRNSCTHYLQYIELFILRFSCYIPIRRREQIEPNIRDFTLRRARPTPLDPNLLAPDPRVSVDVMEGFILVFPARLLPLRPRLITYPEPERVDPLCGTIYSKSIGCFYARVCSLFDYHWRIWQESQKSKQAK